MNNQESQGTTNQPDEGLGEMRCSPSIIPGVNDQEQWNASVSEMQEGIEFLPLLQFLEQLKEPIRFPCSKCGGESNAIDHNSGNVPGIGYEEETKFACTKCRHEWWE